MKMFLRLLIYLMIAYLLLSLESPLLRAFHIRMYAPDPVLALTVIAALTLPFLPGAVLIALAGFLRDGFSVGVPVGTHVEIYLLIYLGCILLSSRLDYRNPILMSLVLFVASLLSSFLLFVFLAIFDRDFEQFDLIFRLSIPQALITTPMGPILAAALKLVDSWFTEDKPGMFR